MDPLRTLAFAAAVRGGCRGARMNTQDVVGEAQAANRIAPTPTMVGTIRAAKAQSNDCDSITMNRMSSAAGNRLSLENTGWPHCDSIFFGPP